jgi:hypothetical protein
MTRPRGDVYTAMLLTSLVALLASCSLLYLDSASYGATRPPLVVPQGR